LFILLIAKQMNTAVYAIYWKFLDNSWPVAESGNGEFYLTFEQASLLCNEMNMKYKNRINHWCVMKVTSKPDAVVEEPILEDPVNY